MKVGVNFDSLMCGHGSFTARLNDAAKWEIALLTRMVLLTSSKRHYDKTKKYVVILDNDQSCKQFCN